MKQETPLVREEAPQFIAGEKSLDLSGVAGVGTEKDEYGNEVLAVYLVSDNPETKRRVQAEVPEQRVKFVVSGAFVAA